MGNLDDDLLAEIEIAERCYKADPTQENWERLEYLFKKADMLLATTKSVGNKIGKDIMNPKELTKWFSAIKAALLD